MPKRLITLTFPGCAGLVVRLPIYKCLVLCCRGQSKKCLFWEKNSLSFRDLATISVLYPSQVKHWATVSASGFFKFCFLVTLINLLGSSGFSVWFKPNFTLLAAQNRLMSKSLSSPSSLVDSFSGSPIRARVPTQIGSCSRLASQSRSRSRCWPV